jgi:hypothetical protein
MAPRKPAGESWESFVDRQIREAQERGEFDDLEGAGEPIADLHRPHDELWWIRRKLRDEGLSYVPPSLQVRKDVEEARQRIARARSEREVRQLVGDVNDRIRAANRALLAGPPSTVQPLDEDATVAAWRAAQGDDRRRSR